MHTDLVGAFTATGTALSGSAAYDPWGTVTAASAPPLPGTLRFQSEYTGTANGLVHMGARWYNPANGAFTSRDTAVVDPAPDPAAANPFAYAGDNPLDGTDPSGNLMICNGSTCGSIQYFEHQRPLTSTQVNAINSYDASLPRPRPRPRPRAAGSWGWAARGTPSRPGSTPRGTPRPRARTTCTTSTSVPRPSTPTRGGGRCSTRPAVPSGSPRTPSPTPPRGATRWRSA
jgi:RHS repeat-associated protein